MLADETKAKLMGAGRKVLHFTCSNLPALVMLPLGAWATVSHFSPTLLNTHRLKALIVYPHWLLRCSIYPATC